MSEIDREHPKEVQLPFEWYVPDNVHGLYTNNELAWHTIVSKPSVREALRRMAAEARRQYYAGETEEGGFAVE